MSLSAITPPEFADVAKAANMSPGILSGDHLFLTGVTGSDANGATPVDACEQFRNVFRKIGLVLDEAGLDLTAIAEMTSYHVSLRDHFELFDEVRLEYLAEPFPAWTAVEVANLRRSGALVEVRIVANAEALNVAA